MSEIVIKGMALPKQGMKRLILLPDGEVREICGDEAVMATDARAIELPPHGRLIDAETLKGILSRVPSKGIRNYFFAEVGQFIDEAPTVVEGEE